MAKAQAGLIGLAVMGENLALNIASKGFPIAVYGPTCEDCMGVIVAEYSAHGVRMTYDTVWEAGEGPDPEDDDLRQWIDDHGIDTREFYEAVYEVAFEDGVQPTYTTVPYGSTTASFIDGPEFDDLDPSYALQVAREWWEKERFEWELARNPEMILKLVES